MYITTLAGLPKQKQLSFEDLFEMVLNRIPDPVATAAGRPYTRTYYVRNIPRKIELGCQTEHMIDVLRAFNQRWEKMTDVESHYRRFFIPKKTGGMREINEPDEELMLCLTELKTILETEFYARHHAAAYAYVKNRSTKDAVAVHQRNNSRWFLKIDLSKFFPSTSLEFVMSMLKRIYPFEIVMRSHDGREQLRKAISRGFLHGGLPMGTPLSPMLTNLIMIPFDYEFSRYLRSLATPEKNADHRGRRFVYTRYADDMHISCGIDFDAGEIIGAIKRIFSYFDAPYRINSDKTHYGSRGGRNWILGIMLNADNEMSIGYKRKRELRATLTNYAAARSGGSEWPYDQIQWLQGILSYYRMINEKDISGVVNQVGERFGINIDKQLKKDLLVT